MTCRPSRPCSEPGNPPPRRSHHVAPMFALGCVWISSRNSCACHHLSTSTMELRLVSSWYQCPVWLGCLAWGCATWGWRWRGRRAVRCCEPKLVRSCEILWAWQVGGVLTRNWFFDGQWCRYMQIVMVMHMIIADLGSCWAQIRSMTRFGLDIGDWRSVSGCGRQRAPVKGAVCEWFCTSRDSKAQQC